MSRPTPGPIQPRYPLPTSLTCPHSLRSAPFSMCHNFKSLTLSLPHLTRQLRSLAPALGSDPTPWPNRLIVRSGAPLRAARSCQVTPRPPLDTSSPATLRTSNRLLSLGRGDNLGRRRRRHAWPRAASGCGIPAPARRACPALPDLCWGPGICHLSTESWACEE